MLTHQLKKWSTKKTSETLYPSHLSNERQFKVTKQCDGLVLITKTRNKTKTILLRFLV